MREEDKLYSFVFRGLLAEQALDHAGRGPRIVSPFMDSEVSRDLSIEYLDQSFLTSAKRMASVYAAVAAFENSARRLVQTVLVDAVGENWWETSVSQKIRSKAESRQIQEQAVKWHTQRGQDLINYTELGDLSNTIQNNWQYFEPHLRMSIEWMKSVFDVIEKSRNVIMHSGVLEKEDIQRLGMNIRDWIKQVGA